MALKEVWPGYETIERIGKGSYGAVYKVMKKDASGEYFSAVKKISIPSSEEEVDVLQDDGYDHESITALFAERMSRIVEEFKLMEKFKGNSHIVSYEDHMIVQHENDPGWDILIRMELLTSLPKYYNHLNEEEVVKLGTDICDALELIQKENIVHRDIKPQNIMVNSFGAYKLGDFGIAKTMDHATKATQIGTPDYIAPEVFHKKAYGFQADQYSLGLVLYWALNERKMPFVPTDKKVPSYEDIEEAKKRRMNGEPLPEPLKGNDALKKAVLKACSYDPKDRFDTITDFKNALKNALYSDEPTEEIADAEYIEEDFDENEETMGAWGDWNATSSEQTENVEESFPEEILETEPTPIVNQLSGNPIQNILSAHFLLICQSSPDHSMKYTIGPDLDPQIIDDAKKVLQWKLKYKIEGCLVYYTNNIPSHAFFFTNTSIYTNTMTSRKMLYYHDGEKITAYKNPNRVTLKQSNKKKVIYLTTPDKTIMCSSELFKNMLQELYKEDRKKLEKVLGSAHKTNPLDIDKEAIIKNYLMRLSSAAPLGLTSYTCQKPVINQTQTGLAISLLRITSTHSVIIGCVLSTHKSLTPWKHTLLFTRNEFYSNMFVSYSTKYIEYERIVKVEIVRKDNKSELWITTVNKSGSRKTVSVLDLVENVSFFGKTTVIYSPEILKEMLEKLSGIA